MVSATRREVVTILVYSSISSLPILTSLLRVRMALLTASRAEKWNSRAPVSWAMRAILVSQTPQPGMMMMRPAAWSTSCRSRVAPSSAVGCWPDVSTRFTPREMSCSSASCGWRHRSKARWKVTWAAPATCTHSCRKGTSISPSVVKPPTPTPSGTPLRTSPGRWRTLSRPRWQNWRRGNIRVYRKDRRSWTWWEDSFKL